MSANIEQIKAMLERIGKTTLLQSKKVDLDKERLQLEDTVNELDKSLEEAAEVDLKKFTEKIDAYMTRYKYPESVSIRGAMAFTARMFYMYPNTAREWYERLLKATLD